MSKLIALWKEFIAWREEMEWQFSDDRKQLAAKRLEIYRRYMNGDPSCVHSPYTHPDNYNFF